MGRSRATPRTAFFQADQSYFANNRTLLAMFKRWLPEALSEVH